MKAKGKRMVENQREGEEEEGDYRGGAGTRREERRRGKEGH